MKTEIELAKQAGWEYADDDRGFEPLWRFAELVRAAEREACARILDDMADDMAREMEPSTAIAYVRSKAAAIRARGETK